MRDPQELRSLARRCRRRARSSIDPEVIVQLRSWAVELADAADEIERDIYDPETEMTRHILDTAKG
jgi:hypothetical protein